MHSEELWTGDGFKARLCRTLLTPASWLYALGWQAYLGVYRLGIKKSKEPHGPVVCIGNLLVGGTGKTPITLHVADVLSSLGRKVVISCSGYGSPASEAARVAPEGPLKASEWGDEAALMRWLRPDIPLVVGRRRVLAAELCHRQYPDAVLLMDDGFQHLPLKKHVSIVLDPAQPNRRCLPAGPYREPRGNLSRADLVIPGGGFRVEACSSGTSMPQPLPSHRNEASPQEEGEPDTLAAKASAGAGSLETPTPVRKLTGPPPPAHTSAGGGLAEPPPLAPSSSSAHTSPQEEGSLENLAAPTSAGVVSPETPTPVRKLTGPPPPAHTSAGGGVVGVLCALGRPQAFLDSLRAQGFTLDPVVLRGDHDPLTDGNLLAGFPADRPIVTTGKDWVKLRERADVGKFEILVAHYEVSIEPADEFRDWLQERLNGISIKKEL